MLSASLRAAAIKAEGSPTMRSERHPAARGRTQQADFEKRGTPGNFFAREPQPQ